MPLANVVNGNLGIERLTLDVEIAGQQGYRRETLTEGVGQADRKIIDRLIQDDEVPFLFGDSLQSSYLAR